MNVEGTYTFDGPRSVVWDALLDPEVLASVLPGCEKLDLVGENEYEGALSIKVGPIQGKFMGNVKLEDIVAPDSYTMLVDGRGAPGFVKARGELTLSGSGDTTDVAYTGEADVGGRLASVGQRLIESSAKAIIKQSLDGLNDSVRARVAGDGGATVAPEAPSQQEFARAVARDVARDVVPQKVRILIGGLLAVSVLILLFVLLG